MEHLLYKPLKNNSILLRRKRSTESNLNASTKHLKLLVFLAFLLIALFSNLVSYAQATENTDWNLFKEADNIKYYYSISSRSGKDILLLRIQSEKVVATRITFKIKISDINGDFEESINEQTVMLLPEQTISGNCDVVSTDSPNLFLALRKSYSNPTISISLMNVNP